MMDVKGAVLILLSVFGVLAVTLALDGLTSQTAEWSTVGLQLTPFVIMISVTGLVVYLMREH